MSGESTLVKPYFLVCIDQSNRGIIEEQYANIIWITDSIHRLGCNITLVLSGSAVMFAFKPNQPLRLSIAEEILDSFAEYGHSLTTAISSGVRVCILEDSINLLNVSKSSLIDKIETLTINQLAQEVILADKCWYW